MRTGVIEAYLARLYSEPAEVQRFLDAPVVTALRAGLTQTEAEEVARLDPAALRISCRVFERKRAAKKHGSPWWRRLLRRT
jgi:hypothetical protein